MVTRSPAARDALRLLYSTSRLVALVGNVVASSLVAGIGALFGATFSTLFIGATIGTMLGELALCLALGHRVRGHVRAGRPLTDDPA